MNRSIGILGGGQLGRMLYESVTPWNTSMFFLDKDRAFPAGKICPHFETGDFNNYDNVIKFAADKDVISIEIENVNTDALLTLEKSGKRCYPQPSILNTIKDKGLQKQFYKENDFPSTPFGLYEGQEAIISAINSGEITYPFVQKARTEGYDGRGVQLIRIASEMSKLMDVPSVIENMVDIEKELSVIVARNEHGQVEVFPIVEMVVNQKANQLDYQLCPAQVAENISTKASQIAMLLIEKWQMVGILAIEFFLDKTGELSINEVAPRPHNSGHHSIEACNVSQFQQLARCLLGMDLISPKIKYPSVMINLVGAEGHTGKVQYQGLESCLNDDNTFVHLYGKNITKPYRKMGHITVIAESLELAMTKAKSIKESIKVISE